MQSTSQLIETTVTTAAVLGVAVVCCDYHNSGDLVKDQAWHSFRWGFLYLWIIAHDVKAIKVYTACLLVAVVWLDYLYTFRAWCLRIGLCNFSFVPPTLQTNNTITRRVFIRPNLSLMPADSDQSTLPAAAVPPNSAGVKHLTLPPLFCLCFWQNLVSGTSRTLAYVCWFMCVLLKSVRLLSFRTMQCMINR